MITIASLWIFALALLVLFLALSVRRVHRRIWCPIRGTEMQLSLLEAAPDGRPIDVTACSAFTPPTAVTCDQRCLGPSCNGDPLEFKRERVGGYQRA
jgi:hypothetical protein